MKKSYTTFDLELTAMANASKKSTTPWSVSSLLDKARERSPSLPPQFDLEEKVYNGLVSHWYLPGRQFCDALVQAAVPAAEELGLYCREIFDNKPIVFHFPTGEGSESFIAAIVSSQEVWKIHDLPPETAPDALLLETMGSFKGRVAMRSMGLEIWKPTKTDKKEALTKFREMQTPEGRFQLGLVCGLASYIHCFPEALRKGLPEDLQHPSHHKAKLVTTVTIDPKFRLESTMHASPIGHERRGHFRFLSPPHFLARRFVWVSPAHVGGETKHVLPPEELP